MLSRSTWLAGASLVGCLNQGRRKVVPILEGWISLTCQMSSSSSTRSDAEALPLFLDPSGTRVRMDQAGWFHDYSEELGIYANNMVKQEADCDLASEERSREQHRSRNQNNERHQNLTQKYMPITFGDLVGQNLVVQALSNAILKRKVGLLYLFYGPHGTGKTSCAHIFARALNCQSIEHPKPCGFCNSCIAQSNRKCRNVWEVAPVSSMELESIIGLLSNVTSSSSSQLRSQYKVFIFDECDTVSSECWSTILKVIDRAPRRVVFVLVCSSLDALPHIIISRCQKFFFPKLKNADIIHTLQWIATKEDLDIDKDALKLIATRSGGSLRDAEMTLDRESPGPSRVNDVRCEADMPTVAVSGAGVIPAGQWEWIMSSIAKLDSRLAVSKQRAAEHRAPPLPDPAPPYAIPLSSAVQESQPLQQPFFQAVRDNTLHNQPFPTATGHALSHVPEVNSYFCIQLPHFMPTQPNQHYQPWNGYGSDSFGQSRFHSGNLQSDQYCVPQHRIIPPLNLIRYMISIENKLSGVPDYILLPIYVAGLKQPLQPEVKLHRPTTLAAAFTLAKELSACRPEHQLSPSTYSSQPWVSQESRATHNPSTVPKQTVASSSQGPCLSGGRFREFSKLPVVRLSASEKAHRSRRGLCCKETMVDLQGHLFQIDLHLLDFHGPNIILGMEWLESLGRVTHDYVEHTMEFSRADSFVVLRGCSSIPHKKWSGAPWETVGLVSDEKLVDLLNLALSADTANTVKNLRDIMESGVEPLALMSQLATAITDILAGSYDVTKEGPQRRFFRGVNILLFCAFLYTVSNKDMEKLRQALRTLSEAEKQLRVSNERTTWLTAALLQLAQDQQYILPAERSLNHSPLASNGASLRNRIRKSNAEMPVSQAESSGMAGNEHNRGEMISQQVQAVYNEKLEAIWLDVLQMIPVNSIREFMYQEGKLVSVSYGAAPTVQLLFNSQLTKSKAEKFILHVLQAFESVLRCPVTIEIRCESKKGTNQVPVLLPAAQNLPRLDVNPTTNTGSWMRTTSHDDMPSTEANRREIVEIEPSPRREYNGSVERPT
ncbi:hypothetical protein SASPL_117109 [Salvia splendens]|uniref:STICHEL DnaA-N-like alpha-beta domain-containing protein n=1 Tax=Salvia splendens TaxID=180675 RepID=A0A8X8XYN1_SALSN|nr:hypothetical protein SASPL_117109 [Salvia splendens]